MVPKWKTKIKILKSTLEKSFLYMQKSEGYLELERETKKADGTIFTNADDVRLVNNGLAHVFQDGRISNSSGTEMNKVNK